MCPHNAADALDVQKVQSYASGQMGVGGRQYEGEVKKNKIVIRISLTRTKYHEDNFQNITTIPISYQQKQSTIPKQLRYQLSTLKLEDLDNEELYLNTQSVPRSKRKASRLSNETSSCCKGK